MHIELHDFITRPIVYLAAIIAFWLTTRRGENVHRRLVIITAVLFVVSTALSLHEVTTLGDQVIMVYGQSVAYPVAKALLENVSLFAIVGSLMLLLSRRLNTARREADQLAQIASESVDAIVGFDSTGMVTSWNRGAEMVFGYFPDEIFGQNVNRLVPEERVADFEEAVERCGTEGFVRAMSIAMVGKGRRSILAETTLSRIDDEDGRPAGTSLFVRDITEQKEMEKELLHSSKMTAMGTMAAGVVQEFGNLLTVISARAQLGASAGDLAEAKGEFEAITSCAGRAKSVTNNLLAYEKRQRPKKTEGRVSDAIDAALSLLDKELERARVVVRRRYDEVPRTAFDFEQMVQVFVNVIINSLNAMKDSGGAIEIGVSRKHEYIEATVRDDGPGIPQGLMPRLFEPFSTGAGDSENGRTGLGLFVCRQIVKFHNGNISVESRRNEGACFRIYLPIASSGEETRAATDTKLLTAGACRVAVVDRDSMMRDLLAQALRRRGIAAATFQDAESARAGGASEEFDVLFVDLSLRGADGRRYVEELGGKELIVIGMAGEATGGDEMRRIEEHLFQTLRKPFGLDELNSICDVVMPGEGPLKLAAETDAASHGAALPGARES